MQLGLPLEGSGRGQRELCSPAMQRRRSSLTLSIGRAGGTPTSRRGLMSSPSVLSSGRRRSAPDETLSRTRSAILRRSLERLEGADHVRAMVRVRPLLPSERHAAGAPAALRVDGDSVIVPDSSGREREAFVVDKCFTSTHTDDEPANQETVFEAAGRPAVENVVSGYNSCVFAYGQTCSGKTYTMLGPGPSAVRGIVPRAAELLFRRIDSAQETGPEDVFFEVYCLFFEIYMERVRDLLHEGHESGGWTDLRVRNHPQTGPFVEGLTPHRVSNSQQLLRLVTRGASHRTTSATPSNDHSSRSHAVLELSLRATEVYQSKGKEVVTCTTSRLNLVDLAGSERLKTTPGVQYNTEETSSINLSLSTLRRVIDTLIDNTRTGKRRLPPYRESVLTWLLSESLGGNSKTIMIGTVSPNPDHTEETLNTLRYVHKAKMIVNMVRRNEEKHLALIRALRDEVAQLQLQMQQRSDAEKPDFDAASAKTGDSYDSVDDLREQIRLRNQMIEELRARGGDVMHAATQTEPLGNPASPGAPIRDARSLEGVLQEKNKHLSQALQLQGQQSATLESLTREVISLQAQLRSRNAEHVELKQMHDRLASQKSRLDREVCNLRDEQTDKDMVLQNVERDLSGRLTLARDYESRLTALRQSLEAKIRIVDELSEENRQLRAMTRSAQHFGGVRSSQSAEVFEEMGAMLEKETAARDAAERDLRMERQRRQTAQQAAAELRVELDLLRGQHSNLKSQMDARGLGLAGKGQELVALGLTRSAQGSKVRSGSGRATPTRTPRSVSNGHRTPSPRLPGGFARTPRPASPQAPRSSPRLRPATPPGPKTRSTPLVCRTPDPDPSGRRRASLKRRGAPDPR